MTRWSASEIERAEAIVNDISEGIDNGEDRFVLRTSLAIYADKLMEALTARQNDKNERLIQHLEQLTKLLKTPQ